METEPLDNSRDQRFYEVLAEYLQAVEAGAAPGREEFLAGHPDMADKLALFLSNKDQFDRVAEPLGPMPPPARQLVPPCHSESVAGGEPPTMGPGETPSVHAGTRVRYFGDYEVLEEIGRGGMGVVYKARQVSLNLVVAL